jgi:hypothetical protein
MVRRVTVAATLALSAALLAGCGGGDDHAKVEANLPHYLVSLVPDRNPFPIGAGSPRVKDNGCKDRHVEIEKGHVMSSRSVYFTVGKAVSLWTCVVKFGTLAMPVNVVVDDSTEVVAVVPGGLLKEVRPKAGWSPFPSKGNDNRRGRRLGTASGENAHRI